MTRAQSLLALSIALAIGACTNQPSKSVDAPPKRATNAAKTTATPADADKFVAEVNQDIRDHYGEITAAQWVGETYINDDTQLISAKTSERALAHLKEQVDASHRFDGVSGIKPETRRSIELLKLQTVMPAPKDPKALGELTALASKLDAAYGAGKYCKDPKDSKTCRNLDQLSKTLAQSRDWDADKEAWEGWHTVGRGMRTDYVRFAELLNQGARDSGYRDVGEFWRSSYDMSPADFRRETDKLWGQVKPLYSQLQCYVRGKLAQKYGDKMPKDGTIPAHVTGNMWAQDWSNLYPLVQPYPGVSSLDVNAKLAAEHESDRRKELAELKGKRTTEALADAERRASIDSAKRFAERSEDFYKSLGFPVLPKSFYEISQFVRPRDRDVVCHASAWDLNLAGDVRIKMCINPIEEDYRTVYHEMGHIYYFLAYNPLSPLFQGGANDGFHEAIGDTIQLSLTPAYLKTIGLVGEAKLSEKAAINSQMKMALEKVAFLPFGKLIDEWRWGVFDGSIKPDNYNAAWWALKRKYQGVSPPSARDESEFDPGAKNHVAANVPYMRYFLAHILQFQFQRALCAAAGNKGALADCSIYGNKEAGAKYWAMLSRGASQPWQQTLKELTGQDDMDATAIIDYFQPLYAWLQQQNAGKSCSWDGEG